jgi:5-methylcytosine-specific restriction endonuclease McrA
MARSNKNTQRHDHRKDRYKLCPAERSEKGYKLCVYCGQPADTLDHVPPLNRIDDYESLGLLREQYVLVPACRSCNATASDKLEDGILQRIEAVKDRLSVRLRRYLKRVEWDDEELAELGPNLLSAVKANHIKTELAISRLEYYGGFDVVLDWLEEQDEFYA